MWTTDAWVTVYSDPRIRLHLESSSVSYTINALYGSIIVLKKKREILLKKKTIKDFFRAANVSTFYLHVFTNIIVYSEVVATASSRCNRISVEQRRAMHFQMFTVEDFQIRTSAKTDRCVDDGSRATVSARWRLFVRAFLIVPLPNAARSLRVHRLAPVPFARCARCCIIL